MAAVAVDGVRRPQAAARAGITSERLVAWALATPLIAGLVVFAIYPFVFLMLLSLSESTLGQLFTDWVWHGNYADTLADGKFIDALLRSVLFAVASTVLTMIAGVALALLLDKVVRGGSLGDAEINIRVSKRSSVLGSNLSARPDSSAYLGDFSPRIGFRCAE